MDSRITLLLESFDRAYNLSSWHGTNLRGSLKGVTALQASRRPSRERHNIWEVAVHCSYWKYVVRRKILGEAKGSFPRKGSNWFVRPERRTVDDKAWAEDLRLLDEVHRTLREAIAHYDPETLDVIPKGSRRSMQAMILGIAAHDLYHAGQIQLIKKLVKSKQ